mmetsp:Transcript_47863/g.126707  ORF Transcript_47863/g.126707 Transcript_47863/m.126707 type:complete len:254 (+) Transcript_47863:467-1228(+)
MVAARSPTRTGQVTWASGSRTCSRALAWRSGPTGLALRAIMSPAGSMGSASSRGQRVPPTRASSSRTISMDTAITVGATAGSMTATGGGTTCTVAVACAGVMVASMTVVTARTRKTVRGLSRGQMVGSTTDSGGTACSMERAATGTQRVLSVRVSGGTGGAYDGLKQFQKCAMRWSHGRSQRRSWRQTLPVGKTNPRHMCQWSRTVLSRRTKKRYMRPLLQRDSEQASVRKGCTKGCAELLTTLCSGPTTTHT